MPLHSELRVNEKLISITHVSRMKSNSNGVNEYAVIVVPAENEFRANGERYEPEWGEYLNDGVFFYHDEKDGAEICIAKALTVWNTKQ